MEQLRQLHLAKGWSDIGYHYVIVRKNGKRMLKPGRDINKVGAHCIPGKDPYYGRNMNYDSVGICITGDFSNAAPDKETINEVAYAIRKIAKKLDLEVNRKVIIGHRDVDYTICPGPYTMEAIYRRLGI